MEDYFEGRLEDRRIAVWGLAFKPRTDDIREAPALVLIRRLLQLGARVRVHDPEAMANVREEFGDQIEYGRDPMETLQDADALAIMTEWQEFQTPDLSEMQSRMAQPVIFDGRNLYDPKEMGNAGFIYHSIGRPTTSPELVS